MNGDLARSLAEVIRVLDRAPGLVHVLSPRVAKLLVDGEKLEPLEALRAIDELAFTLRRWIHRADLTPRLDATASALGLDELFELDPRPGAHPRGLDQLTIKPYDVTEVPWPAAEGTIVALERRGWMSFVPRGTPDGAHVLGGEPAHVHVASGKERTTRLDVLEAALVAIEAATPSREDHERLLRLIDDSERDDPRANSEASVRFAVGCIERARAIPKARQVALAFLAGAGITPLELAAGERFDADRHPASAFERKLVRGPAGRVVATETTGFKDASGVVLSRAVVTVGGLD